MMIRYFHILVVESRGIQCIKNEWISPLTFTFTEHIDLLCSLQFID